jgi:hypothetical protein
VVLAVFVTTCILGVYCLSLLLGVLGAGALEG